MDIHSPLVQNTLKFFLSQCKEEATWGCKEQLNLWADLQTFHKESIEDMLGKDPVTRRVVEESLWTDCATFDISLAQMTASEWWNLHGVSHKKARDISMRVTTMWSARTPCERNWSSLDLVNDKRRDPLSPDSLAKLEYIHWNLQLLDIKKKKSTESLARYLDMWAALKFFNDGETPMSNDPAVLPKAATPADLSDDEVKGVQHDNVDVSLAGRKKNVQPDTGLKVARKRGRSRKYPLQPAASACARTGEDGGEGGEVEEHVARVRKVQGGPALTLDGVETRLSKRLKRKAARKAGVVEDDPTDAEESSNESDEDVGKATGNRTQRGRKLEAPTLAPV
ncbi:hypothetical protein CBR_g55035 [Chara braunii]|uniref:HAT C-terminal dimerisation domain-containing protein n=1 Tax=Chara braunii TaxID=69332 RepID=A0A388MCH5_CHABU|nr:hypothetical protein CBR_g55035 [Chara braunii]|eukprot:GBG92266.1 hypothetical protein CBR_g55035 [Chara braunii]